MVKSQKKSVTIYMEGGGDCDSLKSALREGMKSFLERLKTLNGKLPSIVACGGRKQTFDRFCTALRQGKPALLLVDSESAVTHSSPWEHLKNRDHWSKPDQATDEDCHLMVQVMENWFLADVEALAKFFGQGFPKNSLPSAYNGIESVEKTQVYEALKNATHGCKTKSSYSKGQHSFKILGLIDPKKVRNASPWADRLFRTLES